MTIKVSSEWTVCPSGQRREIQVLLHICGRRFESCSGQDYFVVFLMFLFSFFFGIDSHINTQNVSFAMAPWFSNESVDARYINLDRRLDRRCLFEKEIIDTKAFGDIIIRRFRAFNNPRNGALGCARSHAAVLQECLTNSNKPYFLVMEDDCQLEVPASELMEVINKLPPPSDTGSPILCLSYHLPKVLLHGISGEDLTYGSVVEARNIQTATAFVVTRLYAEIGLLPCFHKSIVELSRGTSHNTAAIDVKWKDLQKIVPFNICVPRLIRQRADQSDIEGKQMDYGGSCEMLLRSNSSEIAASSCFHTTLFQAHAQWLEILEIALNQFPAMRHFFVCLEPKGRFNGTKLFQQWLKHMTPVTARPVSLFSSPKLSDLRFGFFINRTFAEDCVKQDNDMFESLFTFCKVKSRLHLTEPWQDCYADEVAAAPIGWV